ncbi:hypothetical protein CRM22_008374 [Opisthorchis felineus]|uniref:UPAR/Ly6 domain-containing protein n=1 Tax=Opisthorchis felineus TaxID=147828 RepID=A0A4S2LBH9_OPIFE|nr:hypothetical protein CRM22_008374 [Opisthorchis felineus]
MILLLFLTLLPEASEALVFPFLMDPPVFTCYHTHELNFNKTTASTHPNCQHCVYEETLDAGQLVAVSRLCVGKVCQPYQHVFGGHGKNRFCCVGERCNVDRQKVSLEDGRREITCFQSHDLDFHSATARKRSNCGHCVYQETLMGGEVVAVTRLCVGQECKSYEAVVDGHGKNRFCCDTDLCNESMERALGIEPM